MFVRSYVNYYGLSMTLCRCPPHFSIHSCSYDGKNVITCSFFFSYPLNTHKFAVLSRQYWQDLLHIPGFCFSPKGIILVLQDQVSWQAR